MMLKLSDEILNIISRLENAGHEAYVVGGSLRDALLGKESSDTDMTTSALPEETAALFSDMRVIPTGIKHGTVTVITEGGTAVEITTFRTDGEYSDSRHPDSVSFTRSLEEDLARRDFTVNAMAYAPERGLVDIFGGREDLAKGCIRCVGNPVKRFSEDALRILRAFRFSAQLDFEIDGETLRGAVSLGERLTAIARERVHVELFKLLSSVRPSKTLSMMMPIMGYVIPEATLDEARFALCDSLSADPVARLALLLFDSGKARDVANGLRLSSAEKDRLIRLSESRENLFPDTPARARRLLSAFSGAPEDALTVVEIAGLVGTRDVTEAKALLAAELAGSPCLSLSGLAVNGSDLIKEGIACGKQVGQMLSVLLDAVLETPHLNEKEALLSLARDVQKKTICKF